LWAFRQILPQLKAPYGFIFPTTEISAKHIFSMLFPNTLTSDTSRDHKPPTSTLDPVESLPPSLQTMAQDTQPSGAELIEAFLETCSNEEDLECEENETDNNGHPGNDYDSSVCASRWCFNF
jgi:hypothetical protein